MDHLVEREIEGRWVLVADAVEASGTDPERMAVAKAAPDPGLYRARPVDAPEVAALSFRVRAYGTPLPVDGHKP